MNRKDGLRLALILYAGLQTVCVCAESYPSKPITMVVPYPAGGIVDVRVREIARHAEKELGQSIMIENRAGAMGTLGVAHVANAKPDGYTLASGSISELTVVPAYGVKLPFDPLKDLTPITTWVNGNMLLVVPSTLAVRSVQEFITVSKAKPGQFSYGTAGPGSLTHFAGELFEKLTATDLLDIQYKGGSPALVDLIAGRTQMQFDFVPTSMPFINDGRLIPLLTTGGQRIPLLPDVPTAREVGLPGLEIVTWSGFFAPAGTPRPIVDKLHDAFAKALAAPEIKDGFEAAGARAVSSTPEELTALIKSEQIRWAHIAKTTGVRAESH